jgi:hypothetical protein
MLRRYQFVECRVTMIPDPIGGNGLYFGSRMMRQLIAVLLVLVPIQAIAAAATFTGTTIATFKVTEVLDGTTTNATKTAPVNIVLTTDYTTLSWSMNFNVNLVMSGGPTQSFETDLVANGNLAMRRCSTGTPCSITGTGNPSPLSFPDASGRSGAGTYVLLGDAGWSLTDRVVTATRNRTRTQVPIAAGGYVAYTGNPFNANLGYGTSSQYLTVANYPTNISLSSGLSTTGGGSSAWAEPTDPTQTQWRSGSGTVDLGQINYGTNDTVDVTLAGLSSSTFILTEALSGDFNDSKTVNMADYVLWRDSPGVLSPFLTSYSVWRSNFGATSAGVGSVAVPEPSSLLLFAFALLLCGSRRGEWR